MLGHQMIKVCYDSAYVLVRPNTLYNQYRTVLKNIFKKQIESVSWKCKASQIEIQFGGFYHKINEIIPF